ncbi:MAG: hypothetical protein WC349_04305 [Patescibacteria group bacterium]|jgi:small-conductance mechanosensitive channel
MIKIFKNNLSLPIISGLTLAFIDLIFWVWFVIYGLMHPYPGIFEEGLWGMMVFHMPASILLPVLGNSILTPFFTNDSIVPQTIFIFIVGVCQYFIVGYLIGLVILFFKKKFNKRENDKKPEAGKEIAIMGEIKKVKIILINLAYLIFSISIFQLIQGYAHEMFFDFVMFKMNHQPSNLLMNLAIIFLWSVFSFYVYKFDKKAFKEDKWNLIYMFMPLLVILITWIFIN